MNKVQKIDYIKKVSKNLEENHVFEIFERLTRELIVHQPENPLDFLIEKLKNPAGKYSRLTTNSISSLTNFIPKVFKYG